MQAKYDAQNPAALARLIKNGAKVRFFSKEMLDAGYKAANEVLDEEAAKNPKFKKIYEPWKAFRKEQNTWASVAEASMQNYLISANRGK
jgi:TRAP-type mannitol/chloroaromatic compound transport system substrate-binding protein